MRTTRYFYWVVAITLFWSSAAFALTEVKAGAEPKTASVQAQLLRLANKKICNPESEMYCEAHTAFVSKNDAVVLLSVQPTAGLFMIFHKDVDQWVAQGTYSLLDYESTLADSALSRSAQEYFTQAFTAYLKSRAKSR